MKVSLMIAIYLCFDLVLSECDDCGDVANVEETASFQRATNGRVILYSRRNPLRGYIAFMLLCEPDESCVSSEFKSSVNGCLTSGGSTAAIDVYRRCTSNGQVLCEDRDTIRRVWNCIVLQPGIVSDSSLQCIRNILSLGVIDCYRRNVRLRRKNKRPAAQRPPVTPVNEFSSPVQEETRTEQSFETISQAVQSSDGNPIPVTSSEHKVVIGEHLLASAEFANATVVYVPTTSSAVAISE